MAKIECVKKRRKIKLDQESAANNFEQSAMFDVPPPVMNSDYKTLSEYRETHW